MRLVKSDKEAASILHHQQGRELREIAEHKNEAKAGDRCIINEYPFEGQKATVSVVRGDKVRVEFDYGYTELLFKIRNITVYNNKAGGGKRCTSEDS